MLILSKHGLPIMCGSGSVDDRKSCNTFNNQSRNASLLKASSGALNPLTDDQHGRL